MQGYDYIGFTLDGVHSSELGLLRVSSGGRYKENLLPTFTDKYESAPGREEKYYFGTTFNDNTFNIEVAYDHVTEVQKERLRRLLGQKKNIRLVFDETPYKYYLGKASGLPSFSYVPFDDDKDLRIFKGEGQIDFTTIGPYAFSTEKDYSWYETNQVSNRDEWRISSGLITLAALGYDAIGTTPVKLYNPGVKEADLQLYYLFANGTPTRIEVQGKSVLTMTAMTKIGSDIGVRVNSRTKMIEGFTGTVNAPILSGNIYNMYISAGIFPTVPMGQSNLLPTGGILMKMEYDYLYY